MGSERGLTRREVVWVWWCGCGGQALLQTSQPFDKHAFNLALRRQVRLCLMCLPYMSALNLGHAVLGDDMGRQRWGRWTCCGRPTASVLTAFDNGCLYP